MPSPFDARLVPLGYQHRRPTLRFRREEAAFVIEESLGHRLSILAICLVFGPGVSAVVAVQIASGEISLRGHSLDRWLGAIILLLLSVFCWFMLIRFPRTSLRWVVDSEARTLGLHESHRGPATAMVSLDRVTQVVMTRFYWRRVGGGDADDYYRTPPRAVENPVTASYTKSYEVSVRLDDGTQTPLGESTDMDVVRQIAAHLGDAACVQVVEGDLGEL